METAPAQRAREASAPDAALPGFATAPGLRTVPTEDEQIGLKNKSGRGTRDTGDIKERGGETIQHLSINKSRAAFS